MIVEGALGTVVLAAIIVGARVAVSLNRRANQLAERIAHLEGLEDSRSKR